MCGLADDKEWLAVFYCLAVFYQDFCYGSCEIAFNFIHQFHCLYAGASAPAGALTGAAAGTGTGAAGITGGAITGAAGACT